MKREKKFGFFSSPPGFLTGALILALFLNILASYNIFIPKEELKVGSVAEKTIKSPKTVYFKSKIKTKEAQDKAGEGIEKVYKFDPSISVQQKSKTEEAFKKIDEVREQTTDNKASLIAGVLNLNLSEDTSAYISTLKTEDWQSLKSETARVLDKIQEEEKIKNDEDIPQDAIELEIQKELSSQNRLTVKELVSVLLIPNYLFSKEETDKKIEEVKTEVEPISLLVTKDEVIVRAGKVIGGLDLEKLEAVGLQKTEFLNPKTIGVILVSTIMVLVVVFYFKYFYTPSSLMPIASLKAMLIFIVFFLLTVLSFQIITPLKPIMAYVIPVSAPIILISILVSPETAIFSAIIFSAFLGIVSNSLELSSIYLVTSLVGIYSLKSLEKLEDFFKIGFFLAIFNFLTATAFHLIAGSFSIRTISVLLGAASIYGLGTVVLIIGTLLFWGNLFKVTTVLELMELENPSQTLLKDLSLKAPGTYHHSLMVSNLAEKAAGSIKANMLLSRVGSLYHDIGKTINPSYFIENQKRSNIHEKLKDPVKSAEIIKAHVKNGIELAKREKLPKEIVHFIESHHGKSEVFYFLSKAKEEKIKINPSKFAYGGPLPQTKEAAILMLADSIEAKARASRKLSAGDIKELVLDIVDSKLKSGDLKFSDLSLKEIETLKRSFVSTLGAMYHKRIEYPDEQA